MTLENNNLFKERGWLERCMASVSRLTVLVAFALTIIGTGTCLWLEILGSQPNIQAVIATSALSLMLLILLFGVIWREARAVRKLERREIAAAQEKSRAERKGRYANSSAKRRMLALSIKELSVKLGRELHEGQFDTAALRSATEQLSHIVDDIATLFSFLTGTDCRATIKVAKSDGSNVWAHTLARDKISAQSNAGTDQERNRRKYDVINKNIDFELLYDDRRIAKGYYFNNNLPHSNYHSTSIEYAREKEGIHIRVPGMAHVWMPEEGREWPLDYRSAIVWPIQQLQSQYVLEKQCFGFLAIDSQSAGVFEEEWDANAGAEIAEQLFVTVWFYQLMDDQLNSRIATTLPEVKGDG